MGSEVHTNLMLTVKILFTQVLHCLWLHWVCKKLHLKTKLNTEQTWIYLALENHVVLQCNLLLQLWFLVEVLKSCRSLPQVESAGETLDWCIPKPVSDHWEQPTIGSKYCGICVRLLALCLQYCKILTLDIDYKQIPKQQRKMISLQYMPMCTTNYLH